MLFNTPNFLSVKSMLAVEQLRLVVPMLVAMVPAAVFAYKFWRGRAKAKELREACEAAVNANNELLPLVGDERLKLALEVKIATLTSQIIFSG